MQETMVVGVPVPVDVVDIPHLLWSDVPLQATPLGMRTTAI